MHGRGHGSRPDTEVLVEVESVLFPWLAAATAALAVLRVPPAVSLVVSDFGELAFGKVLDAAENAANEAAQAAPGTSRGERLRVTANRSGKVWYLMG